MVKTKMDFHGECIRTADGRIFQIIVPAWWCPWRWVQLWLSKARGSVRLTFDGEHRGYYRLRAIARPDGLVRRELDKARASDGGGR